MKISANFFIAFLLLAGFNQSYSQTNEPIDTAAIYNMSLEELLQLRQTTRNSELEALINSVIGVASKKPLSLRKSPSIISLVTSEEIARSGARDLIDVLRLLPGFDFGVDVQGVISIGIRGNWAHEGKVLLLLDGQEQNEILFSNLAFGNHYSVDQIKKIEVIRGPGSAIYGGFAEYAVINIITKDGADIDGISISGVYGQMQHTYGRRNLNVMVGKKYRDLNFSLAGFFGQGMRSDRTYTDIYGNSYNMSGNSQLNPGNVNLGISWKELSFRAIYDNYRTTSRDASDLIFTKAYTNNFKSYFLELKYNYKISSKLTLTPKFNYKKQWPWNTRSMDSADIAYGLYQKSAERYRANLTASYDILHNVNIIAGGELFYDKAHTNEDSVFFSNNKTTVTYLNTALFTQVLFKNRFANLTLGARYDHNSAYGHAFVPRAGITKKFNKWNLKALYSRAFRAPGIENINNAFQGQIKPEISQVFEFEAGYQLSRSMYLTANIFDITTKNPIVYFYDTIDNYKNYPQTGTRGIEVEYKAKADWGYINLNYTYYTGANKVEVPQYLVPNSHALLGFSQHRANLNSSFNICKNFFVSPSASFIGKRYGYEYSPSDTAGVGVLMQFNPLILANLFIGYDNLFGKGLNIGAGCYNILNTDYRFIQPYYNFHAPLPGPSREFIVKLSWNLNIRKETP